MNRKWLPLIALGLAFILVIPLAGCTPEATTAQTPTPRQTPAPTATTLQPVDVISVSGPLPPINPGGPVVEITLKNAGPEPVVALAASLELGKSFVFDFAVSSANPLLPDASISARLTLIGGGFDDTLSYPLKINGTLQSGAAFAYTRQVMIKQPVPAKTQIDLAPIHEVQVSIMKSNPPQIGVHIKGGLRDGCTTFNDIEVTRENSTVNLKVTTQHPVDVACPAIYTFFEKDINLGSDFTTGASYTLKVNDYTTAFTY